VQRHHAGHWGWGVPIGWVAYCKGRFSFGRALRCGGVPKLVIPGPHCVDIASEAPASWKQLTMEGDFFFSHFSYHILVARTMVVVVVVCFETEDGWDGMGCSSEMRPFQSGLWVWRSRLWVAFIQIHNDTDTVS
jgi:hypothetical protein